MFENIDKYKDNYTKEKLMAKLARVGKRIGATMVYHTLLLYCVMTSRSISLSEKGMIAGALGYLILPLDLLPDWIPIMGFADDAAALLFVLKKIGDHITPQIQDQAYAKLQQWFPSVSREELNINSVN